MQMELLILIILIKWTTHNFKMSKLTRIFWPKNLSNLEALVWAKMTLLMHRRVADHQQRNIYQCWRISSCRWQVGFSDFLPYLEWILWSQLTNEYLPCFSDFLSYLEWSLWSQLTNEYILNCRALTPTIITHHNLQGDITHEYIYVFLQNMHILCIF